MLEEVTIDEFLAYVRERLNLKPSNVRGIFLTPKSETQGVEDPENLTPHERVIVLKRLAKALGVDY